ncbi:MAG: LapA family protein [Pseudomonadota bacterium]
MRKLLARLVWAPAGLLFVGFLVANRHRVFISLDPLSTDSPALTTPALPLWFWLTMSLLIGFFLGIFGMWVSGRDKRLQAMADRRTLKELERENQVLAARSTGEAPLIVAES